MLHPREVSQARYFVVFVGRQPGIYLDWESGKAQVEGFPGAQHRSFTTAADAERAWVEAGGDPLPLDGLEPELEAEAPAPAPPWGAEPGPPPGSIAVDAACSRNPGPMEYRGVEIETGEQLFIVGPMRGTNNLGEFLALVHGLAWLARAQRPGPVYSDSRIAIGWVSRGIVRSTLPRSPQTEEVWALVERARRWLGQGLAGSIEIRKWPTRRWGEIPADFGRK